MVVNEFLRSLLRRWYVVLVGLSLSAAAAVGVHSAIPVTYEASASVVLIPPDESVAAGDNPYLYLGGLGQAVSVLVITMNSAETKEKIAGDLQGVEFTVGPDATTDGPIIGISTTTTEESAAVPVVQSVIDYVPVALDHLQDSLDVPEKSRIGYLTLAKSGHAETNNRRQLQLIGVALGGGIVGTLVAAAAIDRYLPTRRRAQPRAGRTHGVKRSGGDPDSNSATEDPGLNSEISGILPTTSMKKLKVRI